MIATQAPSIPRVVIPEPLPQPGPGPFPVPDCSEQAEADCLLYALNNCVSNNNPNVADGDRCFYDGLGSGGLRRRKLEAELQYHYDALASLKYA